MLNFSWIVVVSLILAVVGSLTLIFITVKYYWGARGTPPLTGAARRRQEEELRLIAKQIENAARNPRVTRKSSFWDNRKVYKDEE